mgnify:FL=1
MLARTLAALSLAAFLAPVALADGHDSLDESWTNATGYLGAAGVAGISELGASLERDVDSGDSGGISLRAGYRMGRNVSIEAEAEWLRALGSGLKNPYFITLNFRFYYPLGENDRIQPYAIAGIGVSVPNVNGKNEVTGGYRAGVGVDYYLTPNWSMGPSAQWVATTSGDPALSYVAIKFGIEYHFDAPDGSEGL